MKHIIFDGSNVLWRAHWVATQYASNYEYQDVSVLLHMVHNICNAMNCFNAHFVWDDRELRKQPNPRKLYQEAYKQNRSSENTVYQHIEHVKEITNSLGISHYRPYALEGDDVMGILCSELDGEKIIVTADQDLAQLVSEQVSLYSVTKKALVTVDNFQEYFPVPLKQFVTYKCIIGDKSDNIPGVPKHGVKRACDLANRIHCNDVDGIDSDVLNIIESNRKIIDLHSLIDDKEVEFVRSQISNITPDMAAFRGKCNELHLQKALNLQWLNFFLTMK